MRGLGPYAGTLHQPVHAEGLDVRAVLRMMSIATGGVLGIPPPISYRSPGPLPFEGSRAMHVLPLGECESSIPNFHY